MAGALRRMLLGQAATAPPSALHSRIPAVMNKAGSCVAPRPSAKETNAVIPPSDPFTPKLVASDTRGASGVPLIEQTIGTFLIDMGARQPRCEALVSEHQGRIALSRRGRHPRFLQGPDCALQGAALHPLCHQLSDDGDGQDPEVQDPRRDEGSAGSGRSQNGVKQRSTTA